MSRCSLIALVVLTAGFAADRAQAATAVVTVLPNSFSPQVVTIRIGDTVTWNNPTAAAHNVVSDGGLFSSGGAALGPWTFSHTFGSAGTFGYHCQPHGSPGAGAFGTIIVLDAIELTHGSDMYEDLGGAPDRYRIGQRPYSSYEIVVDSLAGNPLLQLDRLDSSGTTIIQTGGPISAAIDMSQSLRWQNSTASGEDTQRVRVSNSTCPGPCTANDAYRIRASETTLAIPRFNQSGTQVSVVILQNPTDYSISGVIFFWNAAGTLLNSPGHSFTLTAKQALVLNAGTVAGVQNASGAVTVTHDGRYGDLAGKVVALEPATGFSFDSPAVARAR